MINYYNRTKTKSTTRTIRIPQNLDKLIERDADNKRVSTNSLILSILTKYAEWDRYSEILQFVSIPPDGLKLLVGSVADLKLKEIAEEIGSRHVKETLMLWFKKISLDAYLDGLTIYCRYSGIAKYEMEKTEERAFVVTMHHNLGIKWSMFLQSLLEEGLKKTFRVNPKFDITESSVIFQFFVP